MGCSVAAARSGGGSGGGSGAVTVPRIPRAAMEGEQDQQQPVLFSS